MSNTKKESKSYFNQLLYLTVAHKSEDAQKPYTVKQVIDMFKADDVKISIDQLTQSTDSGIQSLLNGMLDPKKKSKYDLYLENCQFKRNTLMFYRLLFYQRI